MSTMLYVMCAAALGVAALASATPAEAAETRPTGFLFKTLKHGNRDYKYVVYVPREYDGKKPWPTIMFLHGAGESGADGVRPMIVGLGSAIQLAPEKWPFLVIFPQKADIRHQWEQHEAAVMAMLERTRKEYKVDADRTYLTGLSQGGHGSWVIGAHHADVWAAVAPICGYAGGFLRRAPDHPADLPLPFTGTPEELGGPLKDVPLWAFHGDADSIVPVQETKDLVAAVEKAGGKPKMTIFPGVDHNSWDKAYREMDLAAWFLSHSRRSGAAPEQKGR